MRSKSPFRAGVTFHSFAKEYLAFQWSFEDMMQMASELGGGVEIVGPSHHRGFPEVTDEFESSFKSALERYQLTPTCYGSYADPFMLPDRNLTPDELVDHFGLVKPPRVTPRFNIAPTQLVAVVAGLFSDRFEEERDPTVPVAAI